MSKRLNEAELRLRWKTWMQIKNYFPRTIKEYLHRISKLFVFLDHSGLTVYELTFPRAQEFVEWTSSELNRQGTTYSKQSINGWIRIASSFGHFLVDEKVLLSNPFIELDGIRNDKSLPSSLLREEEIHSLLSYLRDSVLQQPNVRAIRRRYKVHVIAELLYSTGLRISELASLQEKDVDLVRGVITVVFGKGGYRREAFLNEYVKEILRIYLGHYKTYILGERSNHDLLFGNKQVTLSVLMKRELEEACSQLGLKQVRPHDFRHMFAYHMLRAGCDIRRIQALLGHKMLMSTEVYTKVDKEDLKNIIDQFHPRVFKEKEQ